MRLIVLALIITLFFVVAGCEHNPIADAPIKDPPYKVFSRSFDDVWRAIQLSVRKYPVRLNNIESGILETDYIKAEQIFIDPVPERHKAGLRYKILVRAVKGKVDGKRSVKVVVTKTPEIQKDFFTGYQPIYSDGLEEDTLLYRIGRYLDIDKLLNQPPKDTKPGIFKNN